MEIERKIEAMGLSLPRIGSPIGHLVRTVRVGNLVFVSGFIGRGPTGVIQGTLGLDLKVEQGYEAARFAALNLLSLLKDEIGDLD
jgi:enamine deaminase RidA (YjgF/YER057c/UK114 family)